MNTPAEFLCAALRPDPLPQPPQELPSGTHCAMTGVPITRGYHVSAVTTTATNEFLDTFRGRPNGFLSEAASRAFKIRLLGSRLIFEDGTAYKPMIARESAAMQERPCWSTLVREVWPARAGQRVLCILTTDTKKRLWPRARVGTLGHVTPVYLHDGDTSTSRTVYFPWDLLIRQLNLIEEIYTAGFPKTAIRDSLWRQFNAVEENGFEKTREWENKLNLWRGQGSFDVAALIAQKHEDV